MLAQCVGTWLQKYWKSAVVCECCSKHRLHFSATRVMTKFCLCWFASGSCSKKSNTVSVNVAVHIGGAFQGPKLWPSFVYIDSRVDVAVKNGCALQRAGFAVRFWRAFQVYFRCASSAFQLFFKCIMCVWVTFEVRFRCVWGASQVRFRCLWGVWCAKRKVNDGLKKQYSITFKSKSTLRLVRLSR